MPRKSKGRQKLEMVKIPNESNLMVTFSKRRSGLFKKASELSTLCGAEVCMIVFSPGKKVFSFGHPSVEKIVDRFLTGNVPQTSGALQLIEAHRSARVCDLNMQLTQVLNQIEVEKRRGVELDRIREAGKTRCWWEAPIEELEGTQLEQLKGALLELKKHVTKQAEQILIQSTSLPPPPPPPPPAAAASFTPFTPNIPPATAAVPSFTSTIPPPASIASFTPIARGPAVPFNPRNVAFNRNMVPYGYNLGFGNDFS